MASVAEHPGIIRLSTGASSGTLATMTLRNTSSAGLFLPSASFDSEWVVMPFVTDSDSLFRLGFGSDFAANPAADGIWVEKLAADTSWFAVSRASGVQTRSTALGTVTAGVFVRFRIKRHNNVAIGFSLGYGMVNGNDNYRITMNIPSASLTPFMQVRNAAAADKALDIDLFQLHITGMNR